MFLGLTNLENLSVQEVKKYNKFSRSFTDLKIQICQVDFQ